LNLWFSWLWRFWRNVSLYVVTNFFQNLHYLFGNQWWNFKTPFINTKTAVESSWTTNN
jgi:hypothetical protein